VHPKLGRKLMQRLPKFTTMKWKQGYLKFVIMTGKLIILLLSIIPLGITTMLRALKLTRREQLNLFPWLAPNDLSLDRQWFHPRN
jgi:hypothetical protein